MIPRASAVRTILLCLAMLVAATQALAQSTSLWFRIVPAAGAPVEQKLTALTVAARTPGDFQVSASDAGTGASASLRLAPAAGQGFEFGAAEGAQPYFLRANSPGIEFVPVLTAGGAAPACTLSYARYVVLEMAFAVDAGGVKLSAFAVDFETRCTDGSRYFGELRFNATAPLTIQKPAGSKTPDAFAFLPRTDAIPGALVVSNTTTLYGMNALAPISIVGGQYSLNGGGYTAVAGLAANGDRVSVRAAAPGVISKTATATLTVNGVSAPFHVTTFTPLDPFTALTLQADPAPGSSVPFAFDARPPDWIITATQAQPGVVNVQFQGAAGAAMALVFRGPPGRALAPGPYEQTPPNGTPGLQVLGVEPCAAPLTGRFVIHDIATDASGVVQRLAASFEQWCSGSQPPLFGEVRINSGFPLPSMVLVPDSNPYPFALHAQSPVRAGSLVRSNIVTIDGVNQPVPISIVGGTYSLNGGPFTASNGVAQLHDDVVVQLEASRFEGGVRSATFTAGGFSATLSAQTYRSGMALTGLYYQSAPGESIGQGRTQLYLAPPSSFALASAAANAVAPQVNTMLGDIWELRFATPGATFATGVFTNAVTYGAQAPAQPGMSVSLDPQPGAAGRSCSQVFGRFSVREAGLTNGAVSRLAVDFEQHCQAATAAALLGEVRLNSTVPFSVLLGGTCTPADASCTADVFVTQAMSGNPAVGGNMVVSVQAGNNGPAVAHNVALSASLPPSATLTNMPAGCAQVDASVRCFVDALPPAGTARFDLMLRPTLSGAVTTTATVSAEEIDPAPGNNASTMVVAIASNARMVNISTRGQVRTGNDVMIAGFIVAGGPNKTVVVTVAGPSLAAAGIVGPLANPVLALVRSSDGAVIATNDDWGTAANAAQLQASGFAPADPHEPAIMATLPPGAYTAVVTGAGETSGMGVVAVYEVDAPETPLANISTRGHVLTGDDVLIGGFVIQGSGPRKVVITGIGASLVAAGIPNALPNPVLSLFRSSDGALVASNDDWVFSPDADAIRAVGLAPADPQESAIMATLPPGAYTAILSGANDATGVGIVAVYAVP